MAKKKKKRQEPRPQAPAAFNAPFAGLKDSLRQAEPPAPSRAAATPAPAIPARPAGPEPEPDEMLLFARAMSGVSPLSLSAGNRREPCREPRPAYLDQPLDEDLEVMAQLADLVSGLTEFDLRYSDEYLEGSLPGVGQELRERLARGEFPVQDYLDLHGLDRQAARDSLEKFLHGALGRGLRHVLVVHGKGQGSPEGIPVLKRAVAAWLTQKRLGRWVLAFCTARQGDGGEGALYVLLRKWRGPGRLTF